MRSALPLRAPAGLLTLDFGGLPGRTLLFPFVMMAFSLNPGEVFGDPEPRWGPGRGRGPVFPLHVEDPAREAVALRLVLRLDEADLRAWNPPRADFCHVGCPACGEGKACGSEGMDWTAERPFASRCRQCGEEYPSARFPEAAETRVPGPVGGGQVYGYYPGKDGWPYYLEAFQLNRRRNWLRGMAQRLAAMYQTTGEEQYAVQAKAILLSFARIYDQLPVHGSSGDDFRPSFFSVRPEAEPASGVWEIPGPEYQEEPGWGGPYPKWSVRQGSHWYYREIPEELVLAYDQIRGAMAPHEEDEIRRFLRSTVNFCRSFRMTQDNMAAALAEREILAGRVLGEPEFVRGGTRRLELLLQGRFYADGTWYESAPSYFGQVVRMLGRCAERLEEEAGGEGALGRALAGGLERSRSALFAMRRPDGQLATVYDTWSTVTDPGQARHVGFPAPERMPSTLLWASGHAVLTEDGAGEPVQVRLQFAAKNGSHAHLDNLSLQLYALGREPYADFGYTRTRLRPYARTTLAHNTVVVDDQPQSKGGRSSMGGRVETFETAGTVRYVSVSSPESYPQTSLYRRSLILVPSGQGAYVVDLFEVDGGRTHEWLLHGDADRDEALELSTSLPRMEGRMPTGVESSFQPWKTALISGTDPRTDHRLARQLLRPSEQFRFEGERAVFEFVPRGGESEDGAGNGWMRTTLLGQPGSDLVLGSMPSVRRAREVNGAVLDYETPLVMWRRQAPILGRGLRSRFLAVHETVERESGARLKVEARGARLMVHGRGFRDSHFLGDFQEESTGVRFSGRYGFVRTGSDGRIVAASLIDGTELKVEGMALRLPPAASGKVVEVRGQEIRLDRAVDLRGAARISLELPDGEVYAVELENTGAGRTDTMRVREALGFAWKGGRGEYACYPRKPIRGAVGFTIRYAAHQSAGSPAEERAGEREGAVATTF